MGAKESEGGREATTTTPATVGASARSLSFSADFILLFSPRRYQNTNSLRTYISCSLLPSHPRPPARLSASQPTARPTRELPTEAYETNHLSVCLIIPEMRSIAKGEKAPKIFPQPVGGGRKGAREREGAPGRGRREAKKRNVEGKSIKGKNSVV